jgi:hypothetical protein
MIAWTYQELRELNSLPLNQLAKEALKMLKESPDESDLYLLQLMRHCLSKGLVELDGPMSQRHIIKEHLDAFYTWKPALVMQVFLEHDDGDPIEIYQPDPGEPVDPIELVTEAFEQLHSRLTAAHPSYPIASQRD